MWLDSKYLLWKVSGYQNRMNTICFHPFSYFWKNGILLHNPAMEVRNFPLLFIDDVNEVKVEYFLMSLQIFMW